MNPIHAALMVFCLKVCLVGSSIALAQDLPAAGTIEFVEGDAIVEGRNKQNRIAKSGERVHAGDTITTFAAAELHLKMADGGYLSLRENTKITLTEYVADGGDEDRSLIDLAKGAFRSVTGWIGKYRRSAYKVRTPMVTIGVRGTDHEPTHLEPGDPRGEPGSYDKVNEGRTIMQSKLGTVEVPANRAAHFHTDQRAAPRVLQSVPSFFKPSRNEQRFAERARESTRTLDARRTALREKRGLERKGAGKKALEGKRTEKKQFEKKAPERKAAEKKRFEKREFEKKRFEKKDFEKKRFEKKRFEKKQK
jgi:FecR protein